MLPKNILTTPPHSRDALNIVAGSGGSRTILSSAGAMLALQLAGATEYQTIGGISGGAITGALLAAGYPPVEIARAAIEIDYSQLIEPTMKFPRLTALVFKDYYAWRRPSVGALSTAKLGAYIDAHVTGWPERFWTFACDGNSIILFTVSGTYKLTPNGQVDQLSDRPPPLSLAIRASCAGPGLIEPVDFQGNLLYDGVLSWLKRCPVDIPIRLDGVGAETVYAIDAGEEPGACNSIPYLFWGTIFGGWHWLANESSRSFQRDDVIMVKPELGKLPALRFTLAPIDKWLALYAGIIAGGQALKANDLLPEHAETVVAELERVKQWASLSSTSREQAVEEMRSRLVALGLF
jgi:hypothetical protein